MKTKLLILAVVFASFSFTSCTVDELETSKIDNQTVVEEPGDPVIPKGRD